MMMNYFKIVWMIVGCFLFSVSVSEAVTLEILQEMGASNRKLIERYQASVQQEREGIRIQKSGYYPSLDVNYTAGSLDEETANETREYSAFETTLSYNVFSGFRDRYNIRSAEMMKQAKDYELNSIIQTIKYRIAVRYLNIYEKRNRLIVAEDEYRFLEKRYRDAEKRRKVGLIRKNDLLKIKVELDNAQQNRKSAQANYDKSLHLLQFEVDAPINAEALQFNEYRNLPEKNGDSRYREDMLKNKNEIKALESVIDAGEYQVGASKSGYYPSVDLSASYRTHGDDYALGGSDRKDETRLQMDISMNLFSGFKTRAEVEKARLNVQIARNDLHELKRQIETDLKNAILDYDVAFKNLSVAESSISQADENLRITDIAFREGVETAADVLDAVYFLSRAKYNQITARSEVFLNYYKMLRLSDGF